mmetsp:Transcript_2434/g.5492  ORF Transcript_2434/g.5492 Transcript_2434/m.5492 type:complete len:242 (-) Transcript_2434:52-777(-)
MFASLCSMPRGTSARPAIQLILSAWPSVLSGTCNSVGTSYNFSSRDFSFLSSAVCFRSNKRSFKNASRWGSDSFFALTPEKPASNPQCSSSSSSSSGPSSFGHSNLLRCFAAAPVTSSSMERPTGSTFANLIGILQQNFAIRSVKSRGYCARSLASMASLNCGRTRFRKSINSFTQGPLSMAAYHLSKRISFFFSSIMSAFAKSNTKGENTKDESMMELNLPIFMASLKTIHSSPSCPDIW